MSTANSVAQTGVADIKRLPILIALVIGAFFSILNETLLNVALPEMSRELQVADTTIQWLATSYMLVVGILIPVSALIIQWFTTRQVFIGALVLFFVGTLVCGVAPSFSLLLVGRVIQALSTGLMLPVMMNTILVLYPIEKRGAAMGMIGLVIMFAPAIGPTLSGLIMDSLHWRWLFFLVLPFALLALVFAWIYMRNVTVITKPPVDALSIILSSIGFGGIVYGFSKAGEMMSAGSGMTPEIYVSLIAGIVSLILFSIRQLRSQEPMLNLRVFKYPLFGITTLLLLIVMMSLFSTIMLLPWYLQGVLVLSIAASGLVLLPGGLLNGLLAPVTGKLFDKFGPRVLAIPGTVLLAGVMFMFTQVSETSTSTHIILLHCTMMIAVSMIMMPTQTNALNQLPPKLYPHGTAILNTLQQVAGAIGVALFYSIMAIGRSNYEPDPASSANPFSMALLSGINYAFLVGFCFAIVAVVLSLFIKKAVPATETETN